MSKPPPLLLGHRGAGAVASPPENTIGSFDAALHNGCDGFEFDVRLAGCGCAVICHDAEVAGVRISDADQRQLGGLPQLEEVIRRYATKSFLDIELKTPGLESTVLVELAANRPEKGYVVSSFLPEVLNALRLRSETVPLGLICSKKSQLALWQDLPVQYVILHHSLVSRELVRKMSDAGKILFVWTVNDRDSMLRFADWGAAGIISDRTELMVRTFRGNTA
jgi:glycerophosphoryl diester phosphodiesterase